MCTAATLPQEAEMFDVYRRSDVLDFLDAPAADLLDEARKNFSRFGLGGTAYLECGDGTMYFPWYGTLRMNTLVQQLASRGVAASREGPAVVAHGVKPAGLRDAVLSCESEHPVDTVALAASVQNKIEEKWDWALDEATLCASYASRQLA